MNARSVSIKRLSACLLWALLLCALPASAREEPDYHALARGGTAAEVQAALKGDPSLARKTFGENGETLLMLALRADRPLAVVDALLGAGCSATARAADGRTPIMFAAQYSASPEVLERLIRSGTLFGAGTKARVRLADASGMTAMDYVRLNASPAPLRAVLEKYGGLPGTVVPAAGAGSAGEAVRAGDVPAPEEGIPRVTLVAAPPVPDDDSAAGEPVPAVVRPEPAAAGSVPGQDAAFAGEAPGSPAPGIQEAVPLAEEQDGAGAASFREGAAEPAVLALEEPPVDGAEPAAGGSAPSVTVTEGIPTAGEVPFPSVPGMAVPANPVVITSTPLPAREEPAPQEASGSIADDRTYDFAYGRPLAPDGSYRPVEQPDLTDAAGVTLLMKAAKAGNDWDVQNLLRSGANVQWRDNDGWTALMYAVRYQNGLALVDLLLEHGAFVRVRSKYNATPLLLAAEYSQNPEIVARLLQGRSGAEEEVFRAFVLALTSSAGSDHVKRAKVQRFLEISVPVNRAWNGKTPLMYACEHCSSTAVIAVLLENGARADLRDADGMTAFDYAGKNARLAHDETYWALNAQGGR